MEQKINYEEKYADLESSYAHLKQLYDNTYNELSNEKLRSQRLESLNERLLTIIENLSEKE